MKLKDAFHLCAILSRILGRQKRTNALLANILTTQESLVMKIDEVKALQEQDLTEGRETAASGQAAVARLTSAVTTLTEKVAALEANTITDEQLAELKAASDAAKEVSDGVQAAFDAAGA